MRRVVFAALVVASLCSCGRAEQNSVRPAANQQPITLRPCTLDNGITAECGTVSVLEDRARPAGRRIDLRFSVLRADRQPAETALFLLAGGPGQAGTAMVGFAAGWMRPLRASMDIVLLDQRGTGESQPLSCETDLVANPSAAFRQVIDARAIARCRSAIASTTEPTKYTTDDAVADLEEVRARLGHSTVALFGVSYGTRMAQAYMRRHPDRVRSAVLDGVAPFDVNLPLSMARSLERSIQLVIGGCATRSECRRNFPKLAQHFESLLDRIGDGTVPARVALSSGAVTTVRMSRHDFLYAVRGILYRPESVFELPALIAETARTGDFSPFAQRQWQRAERMQRTLTRGLHLSVFCSEDVAFITDDDITAETDGTLIGRYLVDDYRTACGQWVTGSIATDFHVPISVDVPVLLVSGYYDPVTPPEFGDRVARSLPRARHIVVADGGHGSAGGCPRAAVLHVLESGTLDGLPPVCRHEIP